MSKPFYKSKTFWGVVTAALPGIWPALSPIMAALSAQHSIPNSLPPEAAAIVAAIGAIMAIYGRYKATGEISIK